MTQFIAFGITFLAIFLKGWQHKNVIHDRYLWIVVTSYLMASLDILTIGLVVKYGTDMILYQGTGAALGMLASVLLHNKMMKRKGD